MLRSAVFGFCWKMTFISRDMKKGPVCDDGPYHDRWFKLPDAQSNATIITCDSIYYLEVVGKQLLFTIMSFSILIGFFHLINEQFNYFFCFFFDDAIIIFKQTSNLEIVHWIYKFTYMSALILQKTFQLSKTFTFPLY